MKLVSNSQKSISKSEQLSARISSLVDGELTPEEIKAQISQLLEDGREREQWQHYHLIRDLLQQQLPQEHNSDFTRQVMMKLEGEPTILVPAKRMRSGKERSITQKFIGLGLAASVAAVALLTSYTLNDSADMQPTQMIAEAQIGQKGERGLTDVAQWRRAADLVQNREPDLEQYSTYLVNHAAYSSGSRNQGFMPYARVVGYTNER
ncbi:MAG: hypothetical protein GQ470_05605 [Gammaproteobacteria bacterium]|nr:hypothetical protein [Gammaproteobacteria bacterium]